MSILELLKGNPFAKDYIEMNNIMQVEDLRELYETCNDTLKNAFVIIGEETPRRYQEYDVDDDKISHVFLMGKSFPKKTFLEIQDCFNLLEEYFSDNH